MLRWVEQRFGILAVKERVQWNLFPNVYTKASESTSPRVMDPQQGSIIRQIPYIVLGFGSGRDVDVIQARLNGNGTT